MVAWRVLRWGLVLGRDVDLLSPIDRIPCYFVTEDIVAYKVSSCNGVTVAMVSIPKKLGAFFICTSSFFSSGRSKNSFPCVMTSSIRASSMPVLLIYRNPTCSRAFRRSSRKTGFV